MHRFHAPHLPGDEGASFTLADEEGRHLARVLRLGPGATVRVFDGRGREHLAEVLDVRKDRATLVLGAAAAPAPEASVRVTLAPALLKSDHFDAVVRDAVMLGVWAVQPLLTERTEVPAGRAAAAYAGGRWQRIAAASAKQCGRAVVPEILPPQPLAAVLPVLPPPMLMLAEPSAGAPLTTLPPAASRASLLVGPEGGWSQEEIQAASGAGAMCLRLGGRTLRADAAPLVALTILLYAWNGI